MPADRLGSRTPPSPASADGSTTVRSSESDGREAATHDHSPQAALAHLRAGLLGGRGPGAGRLEFLEHTRARTAVGGVPVPALRERVSLDAATARGDADTLGLAVGRQRVRVATDLDALLPRLNPRAVRAGAGGSPRRKGARRLPMAAAPFAVLLVARWLRRRRRSHGGWR